MRVRRLFRAVPPAVLVLFPLSLAAQQQPPPPVIRATTRLVQVSCVVEGRGKAPVPGLAVADFRLFDGKHEEPIQAFAAGWDNDEPPATPVVPAGVYSNRVGLGDESSAGVTVILFDGANLPLFDQEHARKQLLRFLATVQPWERVALYTLEGGLRVLHDFTGEPAQLMRALERLKPQTNPKQKLPAIFQQTGPRFFDGLEDPFEIYRQRLISREERWRLLDSLNAIEAIANRVARFPGRKNLVWFTSGIPFELPSNAMKKNRWQSVVDVRIERLARALQEANITVYPVNMSWIEMGYDPGYSTALSGYEYTPYAYVPYAPRGYFYYVDQSFENEHSLANRTGGKAFIHTNDIAGALRRALNDARRTYILGFYPTHGKWNGDFRKIKVELVKKDGLKVRCRKGYYALPEITPDSARAEVALTAAASSPLESTAIGLDAQGVLLPSPGALTLETRLRLDPSEMQFSFTDAGWTGKIYLLFVQRDAQGRMLSNQGEILEMEIPPDRYAAMQKDGMVFRRKLALDWKAAIVRVLVLEGRTGKVGSVTIPLDELPRLD